MKVTIGDKSREYKEKVDGFRILDDFSPENKGTVFCMKVNGVLLDLSVVISDRFKDDVEVELIDFSKDEGKEVMRHSASHLMAAAVKRLFPNAKFAIGPAVSDGFYYDIDYEDSFNPDDLKKIEKEMYKIVKSKAPFERDSVDRKSALRKIEGNPYKEELIKDLEEDNISFYTLDVFEDLCRGPHVPHAGYLKGFKLTKVAGAYWKGNQENKQLQRIYGVVFPTKDELKEYLSFLEEAEKRDHRKIGKQLKLFSLYDEAPGKPFWHPKGCVIFNKLLDFWREEHEKAGYVEIKTPIILGRSLWETSGHWQNYKENMYTTNIDGQDFAIKPMNCPGAMLMFKEGVHSYKELPLRMAEVGLVHRHELSGVLSGLFRVRQFHQDDAHIFMAPEHITDEIISVLNLAEKFYSIFGLDYHLELSTRPEKSVGTDEQWEQATEGLRNALEKIGKGYVINEGDGAFYGPKIDIHLKDSLGRTWQCATIQLDMSLPERFGLSYMGEDGQNIHRPVMVHRVLYGSLERFIGILIEHYEGKFPLWLSPVQVRVLTVADRFNEYAQEIVDEYKKKGIRVELDKRSESIPKKVREAQLQKINYILVIGEKEQEAGTVNVRTRDNEVKGEYDKDKFLNEMLEEIESKR